MEVLEGIREHRLERPGGRTVAWTEWGEPDGIPLLRIPGTPGSRFALRADRRPWMERNLRVLISERPGFGASTRFPGRGFIEHAEDLAAILDTAGIERVRVIGGSGGAPHLLAFCERYQARVSAATVVVGIAPLAGNEEDGMIPFNAELFRRARAGEVDGVRGRLLENRDATLADPVAAFRSVMETAPEADRAIIADALWQAAYSVNAREALTQGVDGWLDEILAIAGPWDEIHLESIPTSITWWHSDADRNCPVSAARRLVARLPNATFELWEGAGHLESYVREPEVLDQLLARTLSPRLCTPRITDRQDSWRRCRNRDGSVD